MEHVIEADYSVSMQDRLDEFQFARQAFTGMVAVDMNEADGAPAELFLAALAE